MAELLQSILAAGGAEQSAPGAQRLQGTEHRGGGIYHGPPKNLVGQQVIALFGGPWILVHSQDGTMAAVV